MNTSTFVNRIINQSISVYFFFVKLFLWNPFINKTFNPAREQKIVLKSILKNNKDTIIGKKYGFSFIDSYEDFINSVPVHNYEMLRPYIEKQELTKEYYLTSKNPLAYAQTSGTTNKPKFIPIFDTTVSNYKNSQRISSFVQQQQISSLFNGRILAIAGPAIEGELNTGTPYGSLSGMVYKEITKLIRSKYVLPYELFDIDDYEERYLLIAVLSIAMKNISTLAAVNPSTILKISEVINERIYDLIEILETGNINSSFELSDSGQKILKKYFKKDNARAVELMTISVRDKKIKLKHIWPELKAVITWKDGNCGFLIPSLIKELSEQTKIIEMGYISSEFRGTIVVDPLKGEAIPVINENFYEFVEKNDWEYGKKNFQTIDQIEVGKQYYILITTPYGLYRYFINDIIEVTGEFNNTPTIRFVQKGKGVTNITGEKVYEEHVIKALKKIKEKNDVNFDFFIFLANPLDLKYELYLECEPIYDFDISKEVDREIKINNIEYKYKRESGRLNPIEIIYLNRGTGEEYKKSCIKHGQRETQFKFIHLMQKDECSFNFNNYSRTLGKINDNQIINC